MKKNAMVLVLCLLLTAGARAQTKDSTKVTVTVFDRIAWLGADGRQHLMLYMDGPRIHFRLNRHWKLGPTFFPTLFYNYRTGSWDTGLGAGLRVDYRRWSLGIPVYKINEVWRVAAGLGFKF